MIQVASFLGCALAYVLAFVTRRLHKLPVLLLAAAVVGVVLAALGPSMEGAFRQGIAPYAWLLGPMTVALAVPLSEASTDKDRAPLTFPTVLLLGSAAIGAVTIVLVSRWLGAQSQACASLAPRAATSALSVPTSEAMGGSASLTSVVVATSGVVVGLVGPSLLSFLGITHPTARGLALGASGHLVATARAWEEGRATGTASTFALIVHGLFTVGASFALHLLRFF